MLENLGAAGVFRSRHVAGFFEQRQIDVALGVAGRAGIAVPVPGAAEVAAFLDDADVIETGFAQARGRQQAAEAAADHQYLDVAHDRLAAEQRVDIGVVEEMRILAGDLDILVVAVGAQASVALEVVFAAQCRRVEGQFVDFRQLKGAGRHRHCSSVMCRVSRLMRESDQVQGRV